MAKIGFIGLGRMGQGMAARLLSAKHQVTVWNRSPDKAAALVSSGATFAETPAAAVRDADAIFTMLANDDAAERVWRAQDGVLSTARSGAFAIECSTLSRDFVVALGQEARQRGLRFLDCPVTGRPNVAAAGELTLLVGAETVDLDAARSLLELDCDDDPAFRAGWHRHRLQAHDQSDGLRTDRGPGGGIGVI